MKPTNNDTGHTMENAMLLDTIITLLPKSILKEIAAVLKRGSEKEGDGVLTCNRSYCYYSYKFYKHLIRGMVGFKYDAESGQSHFAHAVIRLLQIFLKSKG